MLSEFHIFHRIPSIFCNNIFRNLPYFIAGVSQLLELPRLFLKLIAASFLAVALFRRLNASVWLLQKVVFLLIIIHRRLTMAHLSVFARSLTTYLRPVSCVPAVSFSEVKNCAANSIPQVDFHFWLFSMFFFLYFLKLGLTKLE